MSSDRYREPTAEELGRRLQRDIADAVADRDGVATTVDADVLARLLATPSARPIGNDLAYAALIALRPAMARRAAADLRRRVFVCVLLAALPLPLVVAYAGYVLQMLYLPISLLLSPDVAGYVAGAHVLFLTLLFGATYAAIPMMLSRSGQAGLTVPSVGVGVIDSRYLR
jgi:hypothetical protein